MQHNRSTLTGLIACTLSLSACAGAHLKPVIPPRLQTPAAAMQPCHLTGLPDNATQADLEAAFIANAAEIVTCDGRRQLATDTHAAEHDLQDQWLKLQATPRRFGIF